MEIDIKPGSDPNSINLKRKGVIPVAIVLKMDFRPPRAFTSAAAIFIDCGGAGKRHGRILSDSSFDATTVDPSTVCFGDAEDASQRDCTEAHGTGHIEDVDGDGDMDLLLHYETQGTGIDSGDTQACLTGTTTSGQEIEGCDAVRIVG